MFSHELDWPVLFSNGHKHEKQTCVDNGPIYLVDQKL